MATLINGKLPWWKKYHPYRLWFLIKKDWNLNPTVKQQIWEDRNAYMILLAGVIIGSVVAAYMFK